MPCHVPEPHVWTQCPPQDDRHGQSSISSRCQIDWRFTILLSPLLNDPAPSDIAKMPAAYGVYQHVAIGVTSGLLALTTFVVYVRLYIRCVLLNVGSTGWDDLTVFIAWVS